MSDYWWWRHARCREIGGEAFFPMAGEQGQAAKRVCANCPVRLECLTEELSYSWQAEGIFAGFSQLSRERMRRRVDRGYDRVDVAFHAILQEVG